MKPHGWIEVHDAETVSKKKNPEGRVVLVKATSVDYIVAYKASQSTASSTLAIHGAYLHVTETREEVLRLIAQETSSS